MKSLLPLASLFLVFTTSAHAQVYGQAGVSYLLASDYDAAVNWDGLVGYAFGPNAVEVQTGMYTFDDTVNGVDVEVEMMPILINYVRRLDSSGTFRYEAGFGAGVAISSFDLVRPTPTDDTGEDAIFLGQVFGRAAYPLTDRLEAVGEYRAMWSGSVDEGDEQVESQIIHGPSLGIRYTF